MNTHNVALLIAISTAALACDAFRTGDGNSKLGGQDVNPSGSGGGSTTNVTATSASAGGGGAGGVMNAGPPFVHLENAVVDDVAINAKGRIVAAGSTAPTTADFGGGAVPVGSHLYLARYGQQLSLGMVKLFPGAEGQNSEVAIDGDDNMVLATDLVAGGGSDFGGGSLPGLSPGDIAVAKVDATGAHQWSHRFGGTAGERVSGIAVDGAGAVYVLGETFSAEAVDFGGGPLSGSVAGDLIIFKLDANGQHVWSHRFSTPYLTTVAGDIALDDQGNVFVVGSYAGNLDLGGGPLPLVGSLHAFVLKLDTGGDHVWSRGFGVAQENGLDVDTTTSGDCVVSVIGGSGVDFGGGPLNFEGERDIFIARLDGSTGNHVWSRGFGGPGFERASKLSVDEADAIVLSGRYIEPIDFGGGPLPSTGGLRIFMMKLDPSGTHLWSHALSSGAAPLADVLTDASNRIFIGAPFPSPVDIGGGLVTPGGANDGYVTEFVP